MRSRRSSERFCSTRGCRSALGSSHAVYAPGLTTGYAAWPLPAIRQALEEDNKPRLAADLPPTVERIKKRDRGTRVGRAS